MEWLFPVLICRDKWPPRMQATSIFHRFWRERDCVCRGHVNLCFWQSPYAVEQVVQQRCCLTRQTCIDEFLHISPKFFFPGHNYQLNWRHTSKSLPPFPEWFCFKFLLSGSSWVPLPRTQFAIFVQHPKAALQAQRTNFRSKLALYVTFFVCWVQISPVTFAWNHKLAQVWLLKRGLHSVTRPWPFCHFAWEFRSPSPTGCFLSI